MSQYDVLLLNTDISQAQVAQTGDTYRLPKDTEIVGTLTASGLINGQDLAGMAVLLGTAVQEGNLASQGEAEAGAVNDKWMSPLRVSQAIAVLASGIKNNYNAGVAPVATDDETAGYAAGSYWIVPAAEEVYRCIDPSTNIAVWIKTTLSSDELATVALSGDSDDLTEGTTNLLLTQTERDAIAAGKVDEGWRDLRASLVAAATGVGTPALTAFGPSANIKQLSFAVGDSVYVACHVDHDVKPGSTMYMHVHWATNGTSTNTVKWELNYTVAKGHNQESFPAETTISLEEAAQGTPWRHMVTEDAVGFVAPEVDSVILMELKRVTNGGTENTDTVFGIFVDIHYESDRNATLNRVPDFYA